MSIQNQFISLLCSNDEKINNDSFSSILYFYPSVKSLEPLIEYLIDKKIQFRYLYFLLFYDTHEIISNKIFLSYLQLNIKHIPLSEFYYFIRTQCITKLFLLIKNNIVFHPISMSYCIMKHTKKHMKLCKEIIWYLASNNIYSNKDFKSILYSIFHDNPTIYSSTLFLYVSNPMIDLNICSNITKKVISCYSNKILVETNNEIIFGLGCILLQIENKRLFDPKLVLNCIHKFI